MWAFKWLIPLPPLRVDAAVERSGWLSQTERAQEDVGFSSIALAWISKYAFDRLAEAKTEGERRAWAAGIAGGSALMTLGVLLYEGSEGGKLGFTSHLAGIGVGWAAHRLGSRRRAVQASNNATA
ncbi:MAG TPA: hypothetical protein VIJ68_03245 [Candidatus Saccharimonadales bacterium]